MERTLNLISGLMSLIRTPKQDEDDEAHPTIHFHTTHGSNIFLNQSRSSVSRISSYNNGIVFSHRPIQLNEIIPVKILETREYKGPLFFGFTTIDPGTLRTNEVGMLHYDSNYDGSVWLKSLNEHEMELNMTLCYKVLQSGIVKYSLNGVGYETHLRGLGTNAPLWAIFHIYGSVGGIKLVHSPVEDIPEPDSGTGDEAFNFASLGLNFESPNNLIEFRPTSRVFSNSSPPRLNPSTNNFDSPSEASQFRTPSNAPSADNGGCGTTLSASINESQVRNCIICVDNIATTAFMKCGHTCLCYECASRFLDRSGNIPRKIHPCPVCRQPVLDVLRIYFP